MRGIELNPYAAELARVSVWIGEIQWMRANGFDAGRNPILRPLDTIECRDAILNPDGTRADWPEADVVVGNPPFLGGKLMRDSLGDAYVDALFARLEGPRPPRGRPGHVLVRHGRRADARRACSAPASSRPTRSAAAPTARSWKRAMVGDLRIFDAWDDEEWTIDGAAVRVSLVCMDWEARSLPRLDGVRWRRSTPT